LNKIKSEKNEKTTFNVLKEIVEQFSIEIKKERNLEYRNAIMYSPGNVVILSFHLENS
jgi:hypothetical protein